MAWLWATMSARVPNRADQRTNGHKPVVVIVGGGFAGVTAARTLRRANAEIILIDRRNHFVFQPLLYQVATALLASEEIAAPLRPLERQKNLSVLLAEVIAFDIPSKTIDYHAEGTGKQRTSFDYLIVASGTQSSYFGHDEFAKFAPSLKTITDAQEMRTRILRAYEIATQTDDPAERSRQMTFVVVGGGPTGVELAASLATMARYTLRRDFREIDTSQTKILLIEAGERILPTFHKSLAANAAKHLESMGVQILTGSGVEAIDERGVVAGGNRIECATVLWGAGVAVPPMLKMLGAQTDRGGRVVVDSQLRVPGSHNVFVVGDAASISQGGRQLPGVAQVAMQTGEFAGRVIACEVEGRSLTTAFSYFDKGNLAVIGKNYALFERDNVRVSGFLAWLVWAFIHIAFLPQLQNRLRVGTQWLYSYFTGSRAGRLIPEPPSKISTGRIPAE